MPVPHGWSGLLGQSARSAVARVNGGELECALFLGDAKGPARYSLSSLFINFFAPSLPLPF